MPKRAIPPLTPPHLPISATSSPPKAPKNSSTRPSSSAPSPHPPSIPRPTSANNDCGAGFSLQLLRLVLLQPLLPQLIITNRSQESLLLLTPPRRLTSQQNDRSVSL